MNAVTQAAGDGIAAPQVAPLRMLMVRFFLMCVGFGLTMSAFGIWLVGSTHGAADMMLMKLGVSLFMLITGMCLIVTAKDASTG